MKETPIETFYNFCAIHSKDYVQGWLDGVKSVAVLLDSELKKAEFNGSTFGDD